MTGLDWIIVAFTALLATYGYAQGFLVGALSLGGFAAGAFLGTRLGPELLPEGSASPYAPLFGLAGALVAGAVLATGLEGVAWAVRRRLGGGRGVSLLDGLLGAALTACVALGVAWIGGAVAAHSGEDPRVRRAVQLSAVLRSLNETLPPSGPILNALARLDPVPRVDGPPVDVAPPSSAVARDPEVRAAGRSVVRVLGTACGLGVQGSGWVVRPGLVVTNAHVVAGVSDATVQVGGDGDKLDSEAVLFDPTNDIAVLRVEDLEAPALRMARQARTGTLGAVLGFPENGSYDVQPARLGRTSSVLSQDAYGRGPVRRAITSFRARVRRGNSGGPVVDGDGRVLATVFAATVSGGQEGGYAVPDDVVRDLLPAARGPVGTGPCSR